MTNTKFRKRALLSSVAMLLVALVALGSATFAWFVDDPDAKATGIQGKANTALGLVAKTTTDTTYSHSPSLGLNKGANTFVPATIVESTSGVKFLTAAAKQNDKYDIDTTAGKQWSLASLNTLGDITNGGVYHEVVTLKLEGGATTAKLQLTGATVTGTNEAMSPAVTLAVVFNGQVKALFNKGTADGKMSKWENIEETDQVAAATAQWDLHKSGDLDTVIDIADFTTADQEISVDVYVFLDGDNSAVKSKTANANSLLSSVEVKFHAAA